MTIPNYGPKYDAPAVLRPEHHIERMDFDPAAVPETVILTFQSAVTDAAASDAHRTLPFPSDEMYVLDRGGVDIGVYGEFGIGAPMTAAVVETLAALDVDTVMILGGCGTLQRDVDGSEALVIEDAIRDEGTSYHYLDPGQRARADPSVVAGLQEAARSADVPFRVGSTWTTDAIYRETVPEVEQYANQGVLAVEMEVAALLAVADFHDLHAGALLAAFDGVRPEEWVPRVDGERRLERLLPVATAALASHANTT